ncbi:hypothetical protein TURU_123389 [Turdus rufiventris]|nr:hypothetical protein TURU_123389 [Turdus rufiventris]
MQLLDWFKLPDGFPLVMERLERCRDLWHLLHAGEFLPEPVAQGVFRQRGEAHRLWLRHHPPGHLEHPDGRKIAPGAQTSWGSTGTVRGLRPVLELPGVATVYGDIPFKKDEDLMWDRLLSWQQVSRGYQYLMPWKQHHSACQSGRAGGQQCPKAEIETTTLQNPAQFLYVPCRQLTHDCLKTIAEQTKIRPDLEEEALENGERVFVDGVSQIIEGKRKSGYAIVDGKTLSVKESGPLSPSWSAQACELFAVIRALKFLKGKEGTIYTDYKYAYGVIHTFGEIWEERGLINSPGKGLVHEALIAKALKALRRPEKIAVVHIKGHQRGTSP